ncbi:hypothetical protein HEK616_74830 (plasmid) [Streptomyces nigrescens]|uniref:Integral membrane protein n=2 Tax=Streptomyces TaxID=1883 RepID=A0ABM8A5M8_STRNI|nr:hypothetical protein [Streptomyces nigrescens]MEE4419272.1 hypothetical protein [Streptomyces sp. DSM 41528]BDM73996.1 hypothetical protein HEK616_74830 [Streptomyces nigrescens]
MPTPTRHPPPGPLSSTPAPRPPVPGPGRRHLVKPYLAYLAAGLVLGVTWALNEGTPPWEHAAKLLVLLFVAAPLLHLARRRRAARRADHRALHRQAPPHQPHLSFVRLAVAKISLLALALGAAWLLDGRFDHPDLAVAVGLTAVVSILGPLLHRFLLVRAPDASPDARP